MRVAHQETVQDVSGLVGVDDDGFGGGLGAGADPHQGGQLVLMPMLLLLVLRATEDTWRQTAVRPGGFRCCCELSRRI